MEIIFNLHANVKASFTLDNSRVSDVKVLKKCPKGQYYSFLNQAGVEAEKIADFIGDVVKYTHGGNPDIIENKDFIAGVVYSYEFMHQED